MKENFKKTDKKIWIIGGTFLILIILIIFGGAFIYNKFFYKHSYEEVEKIMLDASKNYLAKNPEKLPQNVNDSISIPVSNLVAANEMNSIESYLKEEENSCSGEVKVTNINQKYRYVTFLNCGDKKQTIKFIDYLNKNEQIVENGNGLYNLNNELVYRGDKVNNYITFSGNLYRIVKISQEHTVIIYTEKMDNSIIWDNRYNIEKSNNLGINDYSVSRIRDSLNELYKGTKLVADEDKLLVTAHNIGIGKRDNKDTDKTGYLENSIILENQYIGLLQMNDYLNASIDINCTSTTSRSCTNYNYLSKYKYNWWTITANSQNTYNVYRIGASSSASLASSNSSNYLRPVLYLAKDIIYVSGEGTSQNPYVIK